MDEHQARLDLLLRVDAHSTGEITKWTLDGRPLTADELVLASETTDNELQQAREMRLDALFAERDAGTAHAREVDRAARGAAMSDNVERENRPEDDGVWYFYENVVEKPTGSRRDDACEDDTEDGDGG